MTPPNVRKSRSTRERSKRLVHPPLGHSIEPLESRIAPTTVVSLTGGNLSVIGNNGSVETLEFTVSGANLLVTDTGGQNVNPGSAGVTPITPNQVSVPLSAITNDFMVQTGTGGDALTFNSPLSLLGNLNATTGGTVTFNQTLGLASGKSLIVNAANTISLPATTSDLLTSGVGAISLTTARDIVMGSGSSATVAGGNLTLQANLGGATPGSFVGISLADADLTTNGSGAILISGTGGNNADGNTGIFLQNDSHIFSTSTTAATASITLTGIGGGTGNGNNGVLIGPGGAQISVLGASNLSINGTEGVGANSEGISIGPNATVQSQAGAGISLIANNINIDPVSAVINSGTGITKLSPRLPSATINVGGADVPTNTLGLTNGELNRVFAGTIEIGDASSAAITVSTQITLPGSLTLTSSTNIGGAGGITLGAGKNLGLNASGITLVGPLIVPGTTTITAGASAGILLQNAGNDFGSVSVTSGGSVTLRDDGGFNLAGANVSTLLTLQANSPITQSAPIIGSGGLTKNGGGVLQLSAANTYAGTTTINGGLIQLVASDVVPDGAGKGDVSISVGAALDLNGFNETINGLSGGGTVSNPSGISATLTVGNNDATTSFAGRISGSNSLIKTGTGTLTLANANLYVGTTTINAGTLQLGVVNALPIGTALTLGDGTSSSGVLDLNNFDQEVASLTTAGNGAGNRVIDSTNDANIPTLTVNLAAGTITFGGILGDTNANGFALTKIGAGTFVLAGANTYTGTTTVNAGTLQVGGGGASGSLGTGPVTSVGAGSVLSFNRADAISVGNVISGTLALTKAGAGTVTLTANNTYSGGTVVNAGTLLVNGTLANTAFANVNAGTLGGSGTINNAALTTISGTLAPGVLGDPLATGTVNFTGGSTFTVVVNGSSATQHDQLVVNGNVTLGNAALTTSGTITAVAGGQQIVLIDNQGANPIPDTFNNLPEGAPVTINGVPFTITYAGGAGGNDVVLAQAVETEVTLVGNDIVVTDVTAGGHNDALTIAAGSAANFTITDLTRLLSVIGVLGATVSADQHTVTIPNTSLGTGQIIVNAQGGDDVLTLDFALGTIPAAINFNGGAGVSGDKLSLIGGGSVASAVVDFSSAGSGTITLPNTSAINFFTSEAVTSSQLIGDLKVNYNTGAANTINTGDLGGAVTRFSLAGGVAFDFSNPSTALTLNLGAGADTLGVDSLGAPFPATLTINGQEGTDTVNLAGGLTLGGLIINTETMGSLSGLSVGAGGLDVTTTVGGIDINGVITATGNVGLHSAAAITTTAGRIVAGNLTADAVAGITLTMTGGRISATNTGVSGIITLNSMDPVNPTTINALDAADGTINLNSGTFLLSKSESIADTSNFVVGGTFDLQRANETVGALSGAGSVIRTAAGVDTPSAFAVGANDLDGNFSGSITGNIALEKVGDGTQTLSGTVNYGGGTTVTDGTLQFDVDGGAFADTFTLAGGTLALNLPGAIIPLTTPFVFAANSTIDVPLGKTITLSAAITGPGGLTKSGAGTLVLGNEFNTFGGTFGAVKIIGGTLQVATDGALGDIGNDVLIDNATFAASATFASGRYFAETGGTANIQVDGSSLSLVNKSIVQPSPFTETGPGDLLFNFVFVDPVGTAVTGGGTMTFNGTTVSLGGTGTAIVHKTYPMGGVDSIELSGTTSTTKLVIKGPADGSTVTINHIIIFDTAPGTIASIGSIVLGTNVILGDGLVRDSVPELYIEGKAGKLTLFDVNNYALLDLGEGLPHGDTEDKKTPSSKTNHPSLTIHEVLGPGMIIDLTPSDLPVAPLEDLIGGGGLGKVVVTKWDYVGPTPAIPDLPGSIRTTQSIGSFKLLNGDCSVVFELDKYGVGSDTNATCGNMTIQNGNWGSSGSEIEGGIGVFNANAFIALATLTCGKMGKFGLDEGAFKGLLTITDPDAAGIPTFTVNGDFVGTVDSMGAPIQKIKVNGNFAGDLTASFISSITAYSFLDPSQPATIHGITATDGKIGTLKATQGVVRNLTIVTDEVFKGFNVKPSKKVMETTVGIDNVSITAASVGNILVTLAADAAAPNPIALTGISNSQFITTGNDAVNLVDDLVIKNIGSIGNVTVTLTGAATVTSLTGIRNSTFDALVTANEFPSDPAASTVNTLGKITVKVTGQAVTSLGLDDATFSGNSIGATAITVTPGASGTATAIDSADFTATGAIGAIAITGNAAVSAMVNDLAVSAGTTVGAVTVKSTTLANGTLKDSAILAGQALDMTGVADPVKLALAKLTSVNVTGSLINTDLVAGGSIGAVTIGKDLTDSLILAGAKLGGDFIFDNDETYQRTAAIAAITVKGGFSRTSIAAGVNPGGDGVFGNGDTAATNLPGTSSIGPITLVNAVTTAIPGSYQYAIQAGTIKTLKIGATLVPLVSPGTDLYIDGIDDILVHVI